MDSITSFQQWLGAPVVRVASDYWPFLLVAALAAGGYFLFQNWRDSAVLVDGSDSDDDSDDGDTGGDGGGDGGGD